MAKNAKDRTRQNVPQFLTSLPECLIYHLLRTTYLTSRTFLAHRYRPDGLPNGRRRIKAPEENPLEGGGI